MVEADLQFATTMNTTRTCTALDLLAVRWRYKASSVMDD